MHKNISLFIVYILPLLMISDVAQAQVFEDVGSDVEQINNRSDVQEQTINCFDYYKFGSVQVDLESSLSQTVPGVPMLILGTATNNNPYPIVDGAVYVKVFRNSDKDEVNAQTNGYDLVDQFFVLERMSLDAHASKHFEFEWKVPYSAIGGEYQIVTFFTSAKKFNLLGLSFTDDVVGNRFEFTVTSDNTQGVFLDKDTVTANKQDYYFASFPPHFRADETIQVHSELVNTTDQDQQVSLQWKLYSWDAQTIDNFVEAKTEEITITANSRKTLEYKISPQNHPISFLVIEASYEDTKSILDVRVARVGINKLRLNFPALTTYPLKNGVEASMFSCLHNSSSAPLVPNGKLELILEDEQGEVINQYTYEGDVTGEMMAVKDSFVPKKDYENITLVANLYQDESLVDSVRMKYDCQEINETVCPKIEAPLPITPDSQSSTKQAVFIGFIVLLLLAVFGGTMIARLHKNKKSSLSIFFVLIIGGGILFCDVDTVEAKSVSTSVFVPTFGFAYNTVIPYESYGVGSLYVNVTYSVVASRSGIVLADGSSVTVGQTISFVRTPLADTHISWVGTGYEYDSPYGHWVAGAGVPVANITDYVVFTGFYNGRFILASSVNPPIFTLSNSGTANLSCNKVSANRYDCLVNSAGSIVTRGTNVATYGYFYMGGRYDYESCSGSLIDGGYYIDQDKYVYASGCHTWNELLGSFNFSNMVMHRFDTSYFTVPALSIPFTYTAVAPANNPPLTPVITGPTSGFINTPYIFTAKTTDPDGDTLRYGFDWNNDSLVDQWTAYVPSGTGRSLVRMWIPPGVKTFKVIAQDSKGSTSGWASHTITIVVPPLDVSIVSSPGGLTGSTVNIGNEIRWTATVSGGSPPYQSFVWSGVVSGLGTNDTVFKNFIEGRISEIGPATVHVTVQDSASQTATDSHTVHIVENRIPQ